jgi:hypothetical protein
MQVVLKTTTWLHHFYHFPFANPWERWKIRVVPTTQNMTTLFQLSCQWTPQILQWVIVTWHIHVWLALEVYPLFLPGTVQSFSQEIVAKCRLSALEDLMASLLEQRYQESGTSDVKIFFCLMCSVMYCLFLYHYCYNFTIPSYFILQKEEYSLL